MNSSRPENRPLSSTGAGSGLLMNASGYTIWRKLILPTLR